MISDICIEHTHEDTHVLYNPGIMPSYILSFRQDYSFSACTPSLRPAPVDVTQLCLRLEYCGKLTREPLRSVLSA